MSSISASGKPLSPTEFSWELLRVFEFDGEVMSDEEAAGRIDQTRLKFNK